MRNVNILIVSLFIVCFAIAQAAQAEPATSMLIVLGLGAVALVMAARRRNRYCPTAITSLLVSRCTSSETCRSDAALQRRGEAMQTQTHDRRFLVRAVVLIALLALPGSGMGENAAAAMITIAGSSSTSEYNLTNYPVGNSHDGVIDESLGSFWLAANGVTGAVNRYELDLTGAPIGWTIDRFEILNTTNGGAGDRATDQFTVQVSTDGGSTYGDGTTIGANLISNNLQIFTSGFQTENSFLPITGVTHVQLTAVDFMQSNGVAGGAGAGLREFQVFGEATPIPEPSTFALLGLALLGLMRRRRRRVA